MKILKFGGTSVGSDENVRKISQIVEAQQTDIIVVVSALGGVTDQLLAMATAASISGRTLPSASAGSNPRGGNAYSSSFRKWG